MYGMYNVGTIPEKLKQSALTVWPRRHFSNRNNGIFHTTMEDTRSSDVTTNEKIVNEL